MMTQWPKDQNIRRKKLSTKTNLQKVKRQTIKIEKFENKKYNLLKN